MSLMSSSLLLQQCPVYFVHLRWSLRWEVSGRTAAVLGVGCQERDKDSMMMMMMMIKTKFPFWTLKTKGLEENYVCLNCYEWLLNWENKNHQSQITPRMNISWAYPHGVMVKAMDCGIGVRKFELQSHYYFHFRTNTLGKAMNPLILPAMGKIVLLLFF